MKASILIDSRAPPGRPKRRQPNRREEISFTECVREIEMAIAEIVRLDELMTTIDNELNTCLAAIEAGDEWDAITVAPRIDRLYQDRGKAETLLVIAVGAVNYYGQRLIDDWRDHLLDNIARQYSRCASFYRRVQECWPEVAKHTVWQRMISGSVPF